MAVAVQLVALMVVAVVVSVMEEVSVSVWVVVVVVDPTQMCRLVWEGSALPPVGSANKTEPPVCPIAQPLNFMRSAALLGTTTAEPHSSPSLPVAVTKHSCLSSTSVTPADWQLWPAGRYVYSSGAASPADARCLLTLVSSEAAEAVTSAASAHAASGETVGPASSRLAFGETAGAA